MSNEKHSARHGEASTVALFGKQVSVRLLAVIAAVVAVAILFAASTTIISSVREQNGDTARSLVRQADPSSDGKPMTSQPDAGKATSNGDAKSDSANGKVANGGDEDGVDFNDLVNSSPNGQSADSTNSGNADSPNSGNLSDKVQDQPQDDSSFGDIQ